jgi:hypothetical protein
MADFRELVPERFKARYDSKSDSWYVLDTWHPQIMNLPNLDEDIPENSPAIKIISGTELNALLAEMKRLGHLDKIIKVNSGGDIINDDVAKQLLISLREVIQLLSPVEKAEKKKRDRIVLLNP